MGFSIPGLIGGYFVDRLLGNRIPIGTIAGGFVNDLFGLDAQDMGRAYDPKRATQGEPTYQRGPLENMFTGLLGSLGEFFGSMNAQTTQKRPSPTDNEQAEKTARPRVDEEASRDAQAQSGPNWKKILTWGGLALGGLTLLNNIPFFGYTGIPTYGAGFGMMDFIGGNQYPPHMAVAAGMDPMTAMMVDPLAAMDPMMMIMLAMQRRRMCF